MAYKQPLHKTVHWRRLREIITNIAKLENINLAKYDLDHIICYRAYGAELAGKNVSYITESKRAIWVMDNTYDIFEIPEQR